MLTVAVFTYKRIKNLNRCLNSLDSNNISEILIFNDDEKLILTLDDINLENNNKKLIKIFNPQDFNFKNREFRKPIYLNKAVSLCKNKFILFSDDDGVFSSGSVDEHFNALKKYHFTAGAIIRSKIFKNVSKTILQGTNYAFRKDFYSSIGGYDENFTKSMGGGDVDFWYRIYQHVKNKKNPVSFLSNAKQIVISKSTRKKVFKNMDPRDYTLKKHNLDLKGPMYKWFKHIRIKKNWMDIL